ncbi:LytR/AlgR family response regulator transcription factor [Sediminibacillus albus]|uniref:LytTr DNA-binding domain-containing protein n=1 Tax=Sediminibacillus albus TaxID=407036 RepID=A0A1G9A319_9BACI|nr:LytTR family DNA-binding domain-containing protein [Sediminibacillus albus]SDK21779.1 LytTr DNA-binding domain-containing protein [Sediminibacillus albus]
MEIRVDQNKLIIQLREQIHLLSYQQILYIERFGKKTLVHTHDKEVSIHMSLKRIEKVLPAYFIRTHQSYLINKHRISELIAINKDLYECVFENEKSALVKKKVIEKLIS